MEKFGRFWVGMKEGLGDTAKQLSLRAPTVQLPPAGALESGKGSGMQIGRTKRRNSDSQTHLQTPAAFSVNAAPFHENATHSSAEDASHRARPVQLQLHFWSSVSSKGKERVVRRSSIGEALGSLSLPVTYAHPTGHAATAATAAAAATSGGGGAVVPHIKKYQVKGRFDRVVVYRLLTEAGHTHSRSHSAFAGTGRAESTPHHHHHPKRSLIATLTERQHSHAGQTANEQPLAPAPPLTISLSSPASAHLSFTSVLTSTSNTTSSSTSPHPPPPSLSSLSSLSPSHLLLLANKSVPSQPSLLTRLSSSTSSSAGLISRPINKLIASSSSSGSRQGPRWGVVVDGVKVEGVSMVTVSPQVSGRVKALLVRSFSVGNGAGQDERGG